jgi:hypothetical protein
MISFTEAALVMVVAGLAIKNRTLEKQKELLFKQLCRMRDEEDGQNSEPPAVQMTRQEIAEAPKSEIENSYSCPNVKSSPSANTRWTYTAQNASCPDCGSTEFEMRTYGGPWEYADTHCAKCGKLIRRFDAA